MRVVLEPHPTSPALPGIALEAEIGREGAHGLRLRFLLRGPLDDVHLPAPGKPRFRLGLWEHTCFEAFVGAEGSEAYHEVNLSPSGEWAVLSFRSYRERGDEIRDPALDPRIRASVRRGFLDLAATLPLGVLDLASTPLRVGLAAVLEPRTGPRAYWALRHPAPTPDFHHSEARPLRP